MRSVLALGLLITLCASANAATVHRSKPPTVTATSSDCPHWPKRNGPSSRGIAGAAWAERCRRGETGTILMWVGDTQTAINFGVRTACFEITSGLFRPARYG
jgi:hypothetical protein